MMTKWFILSCLIQNGSMRKELSIVTLSYLFGVMPRNITIRLQSDLWLAMQKIDSCLPNKYITFCVQWWLHKQSVKFKKINKNNNEKMKKTSQRLTRSRFLLLELASNDLLENLSLFFKFFFAYKLDACLREPHLTFLEEYVLFNEPNWNWTLIKF